MAPNTNLQGLHAAGVSIWLDTLSRELLDSGEFAELIRDYAVTGATSNPTIFAKAITGSDRYDSQLCRLADGGERDPQQLFFAIALDDVRAAAHALRPAYEESGGRDGFVSFECTPDLADDTEATIAQARDLWQRLDQRNVMIKVPATRAGLGAIEELTRLGVNVNVTLLFGIERYEEVIDAYVRGLAARAADGEPLNGVASVASFFVSRTDAKVDAQLPEGSPFRGRVAIANARVAYERYLAKFAGAEWERLRDLGARPQRPLWASTGTKDPSYSDVLYVAQLIGSDVVNTMPEQTLRAFADHGEVARTLDADPRAAEQTLAAAVRTGIDLDAVTADLEREGVQSFCDSYHQLLDCIEGKLSALTPSPAEQPTPSPHDPKAPIQRLLVVADAAVAEVDELPPLVRALIDAADEVYVVTPSLPGRLAWLAAQLNASRHAADERLDTMLGQMRSIGAHASGMTGDDSTMTAFADAVAKFQPDHILIALRSPDHSYWQEHGLIKHVRERFGLPLTTFALDAEGHVPTAPDPGRTSP